MSDGSWLARAKRAIGAGRPSMASATPTELSATTKRTLFRDDLGLLVFLCALFFFSLLARIDVFLNDSYAIANTLLALSHGDVVVTEFVWGPSSGDMPGIYYADGKTIGRNYGHAFVALPVYLLLTGLSFVFEIHALLIGAWSLLVYGLLLVWIRHSGVGFRPIAGVIASVAFVSNMLLSKPVDPRFTAYISLQVVTMVVAAGVAVVVYRMFAGTLGDTEAAIVGLIAVVGTPIGFFATVPKRHTFTVFFLVVAMFGLYRSQTAETRFKSAWYKAVAYGTVGSLSWIHAPEGLLLLIAVFSGDLLATRAFRPRELAFALAGLLVSLVPFFVTNYLTVGDPLSPPRRLDDYTGQAADAAAGGDPQANGPGGESGSEGTGGESGSAGSDETGGSDGAPASNPEIGVLVTVQNSLMTVVTALYGLVLTVADVARRLVSTTTTVFGLIRGKVLHSIEILGETDRIWKILFRRGFVEDVPATDPRAVNLSVLESMPALGALSALITTAAETRASSLRRWIDSPFFPADVTGLVFAGLLFFVSLPNLPLHVSYTARYLHPWFLVGLYLLVRTPGLTRTFETRSKIVGYSCLVTTFTVLSVYGLLIPKVAHVPSEAVQLHAIPAFFLGMSVVGLTLVQSVVSGGKLRTAVAILMGISFGLVAAYSLETSLIVYSSERNLLPVIELISEQFDYTT